MKSTLLLLLIAFEFINLSLGNEGCKQINNCACRMDNGQVIDLHRLALTNNKPRFASVTQSGSSEFTFSYNPCYPFMGEGDCAKGVAICQHSNNTNKDYILGRQNTAKFITANNTVYLIYKEENRVTNITLVCVRNGTDLVEMREDPMQRYNMTLYSECACPDGCLSEVQDVDEGLSTGSCLLIFFLVVVCLYLLGGIIYRKVMIGATGIEIIPNYEFWVDFPLLVRDGVLFCTGNCQRPSYDRI